MDDVQTGPESAARYARLIRRWDEDPAARQELIRDVYARLCRLASMMLRQQFAGLYRAGALETCSVVHRSLLRFAAAMERLRPCSTEAFFGLAAEQMRRTLLDLVRSHRRRLARERPGDDSMATVTADPFELARWSEFHAAVARLPGEERQVVDLLWYAGLNQRQAAEVIGTYQEAVSRRWARAKLKLLRWLPTSGPREGDEGDPDPERPARPARPSVHPSCP